MRKIKLFLSLLMVMLLSVGNVWAEVSTLTFTAAANGSGTADDGVEWTVTSDGSESNFDSGKGIHYGTSGAAVQYIRLSTSEITGTITQVEVNASTASGVSATVGVKVGTTDFNVENSDDITKSLTATATNYTFTGSASGEIVVTVTKPSSAKKAIYCKSIAVTYSLGGTETAVETIELNKDKLTLTVDDEETLTATVLPGDATNKNVTWESDDEDVATVVNGLVTAIGAGDAKITCKSVADPTKYAECAVHINPSPYTKSSLIFTAACGGSGTADDAAVWTVTSDGEESNYDGTSGIHYGTNSKNVTYLQLETSGIEGTVAKVVVNARDAQATATISVNVGEEAFSCTNATATNTSSDYTFTGSGSGNIVVRVDRGSSKSKAIYVKSLVVSYTPAAVEVKKPTFTLATGSYLGAQSVEISCATSGAAIYYTLDGNDPTSGSTPYTDAIDINETTTLKAIAILGTTSSAIASATYTIINTEHAGTAEDPYSVADAKAVIDGIGTKEGAYVSGIISQVDSYNSTYKSITYWISADGTTVNQLQVYSGKGIGGANFSSVDDVVAKAAVVVKGTLKKHYDTYEFDYNNELVSYTEPVEPIVTLKQSGSAVTELNVEATEVANQEIDIVCANFESQITSVSAKLYEESTCETEITSGAWVTDITIDGAKLTFNIADNTGDARQVWMKVTASDGTNEAYAVLAISQAKYTVDYATLPFEFDGGRADIASTNGMSQEGLGTDYNSSPKLKFDGTGDLLIIKINEEPGLLTYSIKNNSFSGGTFTVQESKDGTSYTEVASYTEITNTQNEEYNLDKDTRFVKFIYTEKVNGNVGLGNIEIAEYVAPTIKPTITTQPEGAVYTQGDDAAALTIVAEAGNEGALSYQWYSNDENNTDGAEAIEGATEDEYTPSTAELGTVYYYCVVTEAGADEPTTSNIVAVVVSESTPATVTFELFSGELVEGDYVIYYGDGAMNTTVESDRLQYAEVTPTEDKITNPDASIIWHIAQSGEYWTIYNSAAQAYAASTGAKNKAQMLADGTDDKALWTVSGEATYEFVNKQNTTNGVNANLRKNGTYGFACYSSTQSGTGPLTLYKKKIEGQPATPTFSISGGKYTSAQSVELSCATEGAAIYYTTDGITTPTLESTPYNGAISVSETMTIKAIAIKNEIVSDVASATYTIVAIEHEGTENDPYTIADARNAIDVYGELTGKYVAGIISQVDSYNSTYKSITYWISADGETTSPQLQVYSGKGLNGADFASKDDLQAGDIVIVKGALKLHNNSVYEFDYNNQLVSLVKPAVPTVTLKQSDVIVTALNVEAAEVANQEIDIVCANFESQITSVNAKLYVESTCETEITSDAWVTDITVNGTSQVTFNVADNAGDARQVWIKVTATGGTDEASAVLTISQAKPDYATLPFTFDGVKADIANKAGMSHSGLGSDYAASPKLKFDNTDDYLIIRINEAPGTLTYDIKNNSFSGGTFTVQESEDGVDYTNVEEYTTIEGTQNESKELAQNTRYIKFIYTEKVTGNVGLGNIAISEYVEPEPPVVNYTEVRNGLTEGWYYTMCLDKAVTAVKAGSIWRVLSKAANGNDVILEEVTGTLDAGRPYIFRAAASTLEVAYTGDAVLAPVTEGNNGLIGSFTQKLIDQSATNYIIYNNALYYVDSEAYVGAHRAYLDMTGVPAYSNEPQQGNAPRRRVTMTVYNEQTTTDIDALNASETPVKVMINGQIFILRGEKMYDATGCLVK